MKIGFIGLGNMGLPMAVNLQAAGHDVIGFDTIAKPDGINLASDAASAAKDADVVITMLPNGKILQAVAAQIHPVMKANAVHLDCSTVDVESARIIAQSAENANLMSVDAPVSGGIGGATNGTLTFMAGGEETAFAAVKPLFDIMGQKAVHCGPAGNGQAAKICNNMILGVTMIATCEAFVLADKLGLDRQAMFDVVSTSSGYSWSMNAYCPAPPPIVDRMLLRRSRTRCLTESSMVRRSKPDEHSRLENREVPGPVPPGDDPRCSARVSAPMDCFSDARSAAFGRGRPCSPFRPPRRQFLVLLMRRSVRIRAHDNAALRGDVHRLWREEFRGALRQSRSHALTH